MQGCVNEDGPTRRAQEGLLKLPDERQSLKCKENWRKLLLLGIQTGDKLTKPPFFVAYSRLCHHCRNLAEEGCRLSRFHFRLCRYFLGHVPRRNLPWQGLLLSSVTFRKRMTSRSPHGSLCDSCKLRFDRPLWCVWWSDVCFEVFSCFFNHPSIDSTKKMPLHLFGKDVLMFRLDQAS